MLAGVIQIDDLDRAGEVAVGEIPNSEGAISDHDLQIDVFPSSTQGFSIKAESKLLGGFNACSVGGGVRVANRPALVIRRGLCKHAAQFAFARVRILAFPLSG